MATRPKDTDSHRFRQPRRPHTAPSVSERAVARRWFARRLQLAHDRGDSYVILSLRLARAMAIDEAEQQTAPPTPLRPSAA